MVLLQIDMWVVFITGIAIGISPCILLIISLFGTSFIISENKKKFWQVSIGLLLGIILAYLLISFIFLYFLPFFDVLFYFRIIFSLILIVIGCWQIIEYKKEQSKIFGTPTKIKTILKDFIEKNSGIYAFLVGIIFSIIKVPCFGSVYLSLLYNLYTNPILLFYIIAYLIGLVLPLIILLVLVRLGLESSKIEEYRLRYRPMLRIVNGVIIIILAIILWFV